MAVHLSCLLILTGLTGIHSITTVSEVSVKAGDSISIPCLYDSKYMNHVKYLCQGYSWSFCSYAVTTNKPSSGQFSISDDKNQRIFTVTIKRLTAQDTDYWCVVEIDGGSDVGEYFHLSVTTGTPSLYVDRQEVTAFKGGNITIGCHHRISGQMKWCRLGRSCVTSSSGSIDGTRVTIDTRVSNVFTVTMRQLRTENSGWYLCIKGDLQMPVHLTVTEQRTTTIKQETTTAEDQMRRVSKVDLKSVVIPLSLLIFIVMAAAFIWFMLKRRKQTEEEPSTTTSTEEKVINSTVKKKKKTSAQAKEEVTYSDVKHVRKTSGKRSDTEMKNDVDVTYSSVVTVERRTVPRVEAKAEDVTYSTLAYHWENL